MTPGEVPGLLKAIQARVGAAAPPAALVMGKVHERELVDVTLVQSAHAPVTRTPAPPGAPPALMPGGLHGSLRGSVTCVAGPGGSGIGTSFVGPHTIYAARQEWGGPSAGRQWLWVGYIGPREVAHRGWIRDFVYVPPRPYMQPSRSAVIDSGAVQRAANAVFVATVWG